VLSALEPELEIRIASSLYTFDQRLSSIGWA